MVEIGTPVVPNRGNGRLEGWGVHCNVGDALTGKSFSGCSWQQYAHAPELNNCNVIPGTWDLAPGSTCTTTPTWGPHSGAAPGGECVMFGMKIGNIVVTPYGEYDATQAANGGNRFCIKPLPPSVACDIVLPPTIDHGDIRPGTFDQKYVDGSVNCGSNPVINIIGGPRIKLAPGVESVVNADLLSSSTQLRVKSDLTVEPSAKPGGYSSSIVVVVSPY